MINFTIALFTLIILPSFLGADVVVCSELFRDDKAADQISHLAKADINAAKLTNSVSDTKNHISQLSEDSSFYIELSYNSDKSEVLNKDILSKALREMTTIFIGSGFTYVGKEQAELIAKVYIDAEISDYKKGGAKIYDFLSKVTIKVYEKNDKLIEQSNKNIFLSGENLEQLAVSSISKSSSLAAKDIVANLGKVKDTEQQAPEIISKLKIELLFEGTANYKFFEIINNIISNASSSLKVLKRTIKYGDSLNLLVLSKLESQKLAEYIIDNIPDKDSLEVTNVTDNRVVFRIK
jgi:hypothetical protein